MKYQIKHPSNKRDVIALATTIKKARRIMMALNDTSKDYGYYIELAPKKETQK